MAQKVKVGFFSIGLDTYWPQFDGLLPRLEGYAAEIKGQMEALGAEIIDAGMVDNPDKAGAAAAQFRQGGAEVVFLFISTYALSSTVLPVAQKAGIPVVLLNIQPSAAINYDKLNSMGDRGAMTGEWLAHCQACSLPEIASVFNRAGIGYGIVSGYLGEPTVWREIGAWIEAAGVKHAMANNRMGILGHYYCGMLDVYTDITMQSAVFGTHMELLEMDEVKMLLDSVTEKEKEEKVAEFRSVFAVAPECDPAEMDRAAVTAAAMDKLVAKHGLGSLAYYYEGSPGSEHENIATSVIAGNTVLTGRGVPVAGECEVKNAQAMKIMSEFGAGGSFSEFYALDYNDDIVMLGHDGPAHMAIAEGPVGLVPLPVYHGKPGKGLSIQMSVKQGPVTVLSVCEGRQGEFLLVAEGESVPGPVLHIGNTNSRYKFPIPAKGFIENWSKAGPAHHCAVGIGHIAEKIEKLAFLTGIPIIKIC